MVRGFPNESMTSRETEIGLALKKSRLVRGWTQASVAFRLGIGVDYLRSIELGSKTPSPQLEEKIKAWLADPNARLG